MARRGSLLAMALVVCTVYNMLPGPSENFVAPQVPRGSMGAESALAQGTFQVEARAPRVSMAATGGNPGKINLLYIALLAGTAALGLLALFFYGAYSGAGSSL
eukprot:CAMPEP_0197619036 /NCGR_PEP_ID=MMETSP1338-20131121/97_1 /TAXON_ID=43686 ORGANISM="Pelagodinium beii, Strain RCC1491" /NCGR_SAMPLE_ID=MMETSP1338 /ASSEMBLY_ACC=CAM_ASM_000754 /LENGTH=102 /DNA_ID=CAMNT_0043187945 /DNA_START=73 /DNA_END=381 /DNA_ORIENTATION=-